MKKTWIGALLAIVSLGANAQDEATEGAETAEASSSESASAATAWGVLGQRFYAAPMLSFDLADSGRQTDNGYGAQLSVGKAWSENLAFEVGLQHHLFDKESGGGTTKLTGLGINTLFFPVKNKSGYLLLGGGYGDVSSHPGGDKNYGTLLLSAGGGYWWKPFDFILPGLSLRTEALWRLDAHNDRRTGETERNGRKAFNDIVFKIGLVIPIGSVPEVPPPPSDLVNVVAVADAPADADGDGAGDEVDQCPDTAAGSAVAANGCAAASEAPAVAPTASACKSPAPGEKIDLSGCGTGDVIVLKGVNFEFNQDRLTANAKTILGGVAEALQAQSALNVEVAGHTDSKGSEEYNASLSQRRACAVGRHLAGAGIETGRMTPVGYGEASPVADNETDEGRDLNRRVELKILEGAAGGLSTCSASASPARRVASRPAPVVIDEPTEAEVAPMEPVSGEALNTEPAQTPDSAASIRESAPTQMPDEPAPPPTPEPTESVAAPTPVTPASAPQQSAPTKPAASGSTQPVQMVSPDEVF